MQILGASPLPLEVDKGIGASFYRSDCWSPSWMKRWPSNKDGWTDSVCFYLNVDDLSCYGSQRNW